MSLTSLWKTHRDEVCSKSIRAIIGWAGNGKLLDGKAASQEFREFLANIPPNMLSRYAKECLGAEKFDEAPYALQDLINEVGRRLGFKVQDGLYRGKKAEVGYDGLWSSNDQKTIIVEVKTTDAISISLDRLSKYQARLAAAGKIDLSNSSILIVVGRSDAEGLEDQIRGSKFASNIRMLSVDELLEFIGDDGRLKDDPFLREVHGELGPKIIAGTRYLQIGKDLARLNKTRTEGTLKGLARKTYGADYVSKIGHGHKFERLYSTLVTPGLLPERDYFQCSAGWAISVCATINLIKKAKLNDADRTRILTAIAQILIARPKYSQAQLDAFKDRLTSQVGHA
ncbi:MAG: hypothetical protein NTV08_01745 [Verrucomicrobia bacterium]|nr:hypothetical protein [Verrucomicrobiota bacterium]